LRVKRQSLDVAALADGRNEAWNAVEEEEIVLSPAPIALTGRVSPYMSRTSGHGKIDKLKIRVSHNGSILSIRLAWCDPDKDDEISDLDQFADAAAVMFPLASGASAFSMGSPGRAVNAWLWKADDPAPFDVFAEGYATSQRRFANTSGLKTTSHYVDGHWIVVFQRPLNVLQGDYVPLEPGSESAIAFALWEGSNNERSAQKSVSGEFVPMTVDA